MSVKPVFNNLFEIPETIRVYQGGRLDFEQAKALVDRAYALGKDGNPDMGQAREEFVDSHEIEGDIWVKKAVS
jgi:hypothetical protein